MTGALRHAQACFRTWMVDDALPVWATAGRDAAGFGFQEHLTLDGLPAGVPFKRMRVQARQIYVFSHAHHLGLVGGIDAAADALRFITAEGMRPDGAWVRTLGRRGGVLDPAVDLYDVAFVLLALAWFARATGDPAPLHQARHTLHWVRSHMAAPGGGYHNALPPEGGHRQQNPHMHLLEAALALYEASPEALFADVAGEMVALFRNHFHHPETGSLGEFYDEGLRPAAGPAGTHVEPGHLYEWAWLLHRFGRLFGDQAGPEIARLYGYAETHGRDPTGVAILDVLNRDGSMRTASSRLWPQTEALKAHTALAARGLAVDERIAAGLTYLLASHLTDCPRGTWRDQFASVGGPALSGKIPASSLYHLFSAFAELQVFTHA